MLASQHDSRGWKITPIWIRFSLSFRWRNINGGFTSYKDARTRQKSNRCIMDKLDASILATLCSLETGWNVILVCDASGNSSASQLALSFQQSGVAATTTNTYHPPTKRHYHSCCFNIHLLLFSHWVWPAEFNHCVPSLLQPTLDSTSSSISLGF